MVTFSANLGFLWRDLPLADAIRRAGAAGFDAVECHWPYDEPTDQVAAALDESGLPMVCVNTRRGGASAFGLAAVPDRRAEARRHIDEAVDWAWSMQARAVHVMAGVTAQTPAAFMTMLSNLRYACARAAEFDLSVLIEPLNAVDNPGYWLATNADAAGVIEAVDRPNLKLLFDCYHVQMTEGDVIGELEQRLPVVGHVQLASVPGRVEPGVGQPDYRRVFELLDRSGWTQPLGAEYRTGDRDVEATLDWMTSLR